MVAVNALRWKRKFGKRKDIATVLFQPMGHMEMHECLVHKNFLLRLVGVSGVVVLAESRLTFGFTRKNDKTIACWIMGVVLVH